MPVRRFKGNFIGTDTTGSLDWTSGFYGISFRVRLRESSSAGPRRVPGTRSRTSVNGVRVWGTGGSNNSILRNLIYANGSAGSSWR